MLLPSPSASWPGRVVSESSQRLAGHKGGFPRVLTAGAATPSWRSLERQRWGPSAESWSGSSPSRHFVGLTQEPTSGFTHGLLHLFRRAKLEAVDQKTERREVGPDG